MYLENGEVSWDGQTQAAAAVSVVLRSSNPQPSPTALSDLPRVELHGVWFHAITEQGCIEHIMGELSAARGGVVVTPNVDHLRRRGRDLSFLALLAEASLVVADGMPLVWASRLQGTPLPQRVAGSDLISSLSAAAASQGRSVFLLGGDPGTAQGASLILRDRYPQLRVVGTLCPPRGFEKNEAELARVAEALNKAQPDIVYVGLGSPKQELLMDRMRRVLPGAWWLGVGVSFSFLCGEVRRAPLWMRKWGLEWVHRLLQEPRRLFRRYVVMGMPFAMLMMVRAAIRGIPTRLLGPVYSEAAIGARGTPQLTRHPSADPAPAASDSTGRSRRLATAGRANRAAAPAAGQLRGLVLLGGSVRPSPLAAVIDQSVLDLPIGQGGTVLTRWLDQADDLARRLRLDRLPVRLLVDSNAPAPRSGSRDRFSLERDADEYRGTGGLLASIAIEYDDDDLILVANAAQLLLDPLAALFKALRRTGGAVGLMSDRDGTPGGVMLLTCRTLRLIPPIGFVDMKEQALPLIAKRFDVRVLQSRRPTGLSLRSLSDYVAALRALHAPAIRSIVDPLAEEWKSMFAIVEPGAAVAPSARLYDSVVLSGGAVEAGAVVVRSLVTSSGVVRKDRKAVDQYVTADTAPKPRRRVLSLRGS
jgi:N-acetylglucosaminyldiphosphoundecaprenol N-acetyl-beta-D-mannosaminyltransferase